MAGQGRLNIDDGGRGDPIPLLLVHGNGANLTQWRAQLDYLRASRRAAAFDLRGMGKSEAAPDGDYSVGGMTADVDAVANALGLRRFILVGHSFGGTVVAAYAAKHPERVAGVLFADAAGNVKVSEAEAQAFFAELRKDKRAFVRNWFEPILKPSRPQVREAVFASVDRTPLEVFRGALEGALQIDVGALLSAYSGPRLAIAAADIENPYSLHVQFPDVPVKKMHGVGHWLMMDEPIEFNRLMDGFLEQVNS